MARPTGLAVPPNLSTALGFLGLESRAFPARATCWSEMFGTSLVSPTWPRPASYVDEAHIAWMWYAHVSISGWQVAVHVVRLVNFALTAKRVVRSVSTSTCHRRSAVLQ